jgi:hypothetical protein
MWNIDSLGVLAIIGAIQILTLTIVQAVIGYFKDQRDAEARAKEKAEDYKRQDLVADRVAAVALQAKEAARLVAARVETVATNNMTANADLIARTDLVARLASEANVRVEAQLIAIDEQGRKIHILVNSDMTTARTNERDQTRLTLLALLHVKALSQKLGVPLTPGEEQAIEDAKIRIEELNQLLADRLAAQRRVDDEQDLRQKMAIKQIKVLTGDVASPDEHDAGKVVLGEVVSVDDEKPEKKS